MNDLIKNSESMDSVERGYWLEILPSLDDKQKQRLYDILEKERSKMAALYEWLGRESARIAAK